MLIGMSAMQTESQHLRLSVEILSVIGYSWVLLGRGKWGVQDCASEDKKNAGDKIAGMHCGSIVKCRMRMQDYRT